MNEQERREQEAFDAFKDNMTKENQDKWLEAAKELDKSK